MRFIQILLLLFRKRIFDFFLRRVDKFIVLSRSSEQILLDYGIERSKISVIRLPPPYSFIKSKPEQTMEGNFILFLGWLQKRKGLHTLLEAMPLVWDKFPGIRLYIITQRVKWEQKYENLIESKIKNFPSNRCVFLLGEKKPDELKDLIQKASIIVIPEQWENMASLIVIEAMLMSKAIVASNIGGIPEFIEHQKEGLLACHFNPVDFAEKILYLLNNRQIAETFGKNAYQKILKMVDKNIIADKYVEQYEKSCIS
jgi:glycosyltransferase involved in cell wall biosynthesis